MQADSPSKYFQDRIKICLFLSLLPEENTYDYPILQLQQLILSRSIFG
jgi:hypothetical protein